MSCGAPDSVEVRADRTGRPAGGPGCVGSEKPTRRSADDATVDLVAELGAAAKTRKSKPRLTPPPTAELRVPVRRAPAQRKEDDDSSDGSRAASAA